MKRLLLIYILCGTSFLSVHASENLWVGTWTLDPARSHLIGSSFTYSQTADGMYHYSEGPKSTYTSFRMDGREYSTGGTSTSTWTVAGDNAWDTVHKTNGVVTGRIHRQLSADGTFFYMTAEGMQPDGVTYHDSLTYKRLTAGEGLLGRWVSTKVDSSVADTIVVLAAPRSLYRWEVPAYKVAIEAKLDGSDTAITGPLVSPGRTVALKQLNSHRILYTYKLNGTVESVEIQTLAGDGKTFTDVSWTPGKRSERSTALYVRQ